MTAMSVEYARDRILAALTLSLSTDPAVKSSIYTNATFHDIKTLVKRFYNLLQDSIILPSGMKNSLTNKVVYQAAEKLYHGKQDVHA